MKYWEIFVIAVGLAMDAFAVSICKGLSAKKIYFTQALKAGIWFGGFQALMPVIGFYLGKTVGVWIEAIDHWVVFVVLAWIGIDLIRSASHQEEMDARFDWKSMLPLAIATSIDAMATGITFSLLEVPLWSSVGMIGIITAIVSFFGVMMGMKLGTIFQKRAQIFGGSVLIFMGLRILLFHLGILS